MKKEKDKQKETLAHSLRYLPHKGFWRGWCQCAALAVSMRRIDLANPPH